MAAHIARQPRVRLGMNILRAYTIAWLELGGRDGITAEIAAHHHALDVVDRERAALERLRRLARVSVRNFFGADIALVDEVVFQSEQPFLVIRAVEIDLGRQA